MRFPFEHGGTTELLSMQQILRQALRPRPRGAPGRGRGADTGLAGQRPAADVHLQQPGPRPQDRLRAAPLRRPDGARATWPTRSSREVVDALMTAAERHHARCSATTASRAGCWACEQLYDYDRYAPLFPDQPTCDWPTARQIVEESYQAFSPQGGDRSSASSSTSAGSTPSCGPASAAAPSAAAPCPASIRTS